MKNPALVLFVFGFLILAPPALAQRQGNAAIVNLARLEGREKTGEGLWVASTGHSCAAPAIRPFRTLAGAAGYENHTQMFQFGGGASGTARMQWERTGDKQEVKPALETGQFDRLTFAHFLKKPVEVEDYQLWMDLALKHNPEIRFHIQDLWPWTSDLFDKDSGEVTLEKYEAAMKRFSGDLAEKVAALNQRYENRVSVIPVGPAMVELVRRFEAGELPGVDGLVVPPAESQKVGLYRDHIHPGAAVGWLEGYVWFACLYGENPEALEETLGYHKNDPALDKILRSVAWQAVTTHPLSGVTAKK